MRQDDEPHVSHGTSNTFRDGTHSVPPWLGLLYSIMIVKKSLLVLD